MESFKRNEILSFFLIQYKRFENVSKKKSVTKKLNTDITTKEKEKKRERDTNNPPKVKKSFKNIRNAFSFPNYHQRLENSNKMNDVFCSSSKLPSRREANEIEKKLLTQDRALTHDNYHSST